MIDAKEGVTIGAGICATLAAIYAFLRKLFVTKDDLEKRLSEVVPRELHCLTHGALDKRLDDMDRHANERHVETLDAIRELRGSQGPR